MNERNRLLQAIAAQETLRGSVPDDVLDTTLAALRARLDALSAVTDRDASPDSPPAHTAARGPVGTRRRLATVLFADISGFTSMSETMDPEELSEALDEVWHAVDDAIVRFGGVIDKHIGDAVMATWGLVDAREDDPERAVRAALAMHEALAALPQDPRRPALSLRIGVNSGPLVATAVASTHEFTVVGDTVNVAARLESAAPVGGVLIGHDTYQHVRGIFSVAARDPLAVKGKRGPLRTYLVSAVRPRAFRLRARGIEGVETRMVGRGRELARLQALLTATAATGTAHWVTVVAEAGFGKSRLLYEFEDWLRVQPHEVRLLRGNATEQHRTVPFALVRDMVFLRFEIAEDDPPEVARRKLHDGLVEVAGVEGVALAGALGHLIGVEGDLAADAAGAPHADAETRRHEGMLAVERLVRLAAGRMPVVLLIEDLHWADAGSLDVVEHLNRRCRDSPVFVLALTRPELFERRPRWLDDPRDERMELRPLTAAETADLVDDLLQRVAAVPQEVRTRAVANADGNPYYVEESVRMMIDDGVIVVDDETWTIEPSRLGAHGVPSTLTGIIQARLDRLSPREFTVLQRAAVVGPAFWDAALPAEGLTAAEIGDALTTLEARGLVAMQVESDFAGTKEFRFAHAILHAVTYETVLRRERQLYHRAVAEWLLARTDGVAHAVLIAHHLEAAADRHGAAHWYCVAARRAKDLYATADAVEHLRSALRQDALDVRATMQVLDDLSQALVVAARYDEALGVAEQMHARAAAEGDLVQVGFAVVGRAIALVRLGRTHEALALCEEGVRLTAGTPDARRVRIELLTELGWILLRLGRADEAVARGRHALELVDPAGDIRGTRGAHSLTGSAYSALGQYESAAHHHTAALALSRRMGDRRNESSDLTNLAELARLAGDHEGAVVLFDQVLADQHEIGDRDQAALVLSNLGGALTGCGRFEEAAARLEEALAAFAASGGSEHTSETHRFLAEARLGAGDLEGAAAEAALAMELARRGGNPDHLGHAWRVLGLLTHLTGEPGPPAADGSTLDAAACLREAEAVFADAGMAGERARALLDRATIAAAVGDAETATALRSEARATFEQLGLHRLAAGVP
jgi:class 3 adenylate cyclase/tetratricopeptide (TPR) repeat protein